MCMKFSAMLHTLKKNVMGILSYIRVLYVENMMWKCSVCGKDLSTKYSLARHMRRHFEETPQYSCEFCGLQFSWKESLNFHTKKKHGNVIQADGYGNREAN